MRSLFALIGITLCLGSCRTAEPAPHPVVGTWFVTTPEAPFRYHMFAFHSDGTMQQSNPDAGNAHTSDSSGLGVWTRDGDHVVRGKFVEVTADRETHQFVSRGEISFRIEVTGDRFSGPATALFSDLDGKPLRAPIQATLTGQRIQP